MGEILRPTSEGSLWVTSPNPEAPLMIDPNYFATEHDRRVGAGVLRTMRSIFEQSPIAERVAFETTPGVDAQTDDELVDAALVTGATGHHAIGTCGMGPNADDVVDDKLRVRGIDGLRVVDLSIMPIMLSGNTNGPAMAMAWRAADLILDGQAPAHPRRTVCGRTPPESPTTPVRLPPRWLTGVKRPRSRDREIDLVATVQAIPWDGRGDSGSAGVLHERASRRPCQAVGRRHVPVHRHRGLDPAMGERRRRHGRRRSMRTTRRCARPSRSHRGWLFKHTGDGVCAVFSSPRSAVHAAVAAQRALELPVRMGLATGEAELRGDDYFGPVPNRAARVMACGHGGQILLDGQTAGLVST